MNRITPDEGWFSIQGFGIVTGTCVAAVTIAGSITGMSMLWRITVVIFTDFCG